MSDVTAPVVPPSWRDVITRPVEVRLVDPTDHGPASIAIDRPSAIAIEIHNRSEHRLRFLPPRHRAHRGLERHNLQVSLRPHTVVDHHAVTVGEGTDGLWALTAEPADANGGRQVLTLVVGRDLDLQPGEVRTVVLDSLVGDAFGDDRLTHAAVHYDGLALVAHDHRPGGNLTDRSLCPLAVVHSEAGDRVDLRTARSGTHAADDRFAARFVTGADLVGDGETANMLLIEVRNATGRDLDLRTDAETVPRFVVEVDEPPAPTALLGGAGTLAISEESDHLPERWVPIDQRWLEPAESHVWPAGWSFRFWVRIHTDVDNGVYPLRLRWEHLPEVEAGELTLLVDVSLLSRSIWATDQSGGPLRLWNGAELQFATGLLNGVGRPTAWVAVSQAAETYGRLGVDAEHGLRIAVPRNGESEVTLLPGDGLAIRSPRLHVTADAVDLDTPAATVSGNLTVRGQIRAVDGEDIRLVAQRGTVTVVGPLEVQGGIRAVGPLEAGNVRTGNVDAGFLNSRTEVRGRTLTIGDGRFTVTDEAIRFGRWGLIPFDDELYVARFTADGTGWTTHVLLGVREGTDEPQPFIPNLR